MANKGLLVGYVNSRQGRPISAAEVYLTSMTGSGTGSEIETKGERSGYKRWPLATSNSRGYFELAFTWSGAEIAESMGTSGKLWLGVMAQKDIGNERASTSYGTRQLLPGFLIKDVLGPAGLTTSPFSSLPDLLSFSKDLIESFRKIKSHPIFKLDMMSSEGWLVLSRSTSPSGGRRLSRHPVRRRQA
jgi:hypothetical protein